MFDSSMVNETSGFEPLKFRCIRLAHMSKDTFCDIMAHSVYLISSPEYPDLFKWNFNS